MTSDRASWPKVAAAFLVLFALYQASEWWQTIHDPASPIGPALMLLALLAAWPIGRWLGGSGYAAFGLENFPRWWLWLPVGMMLAAAAKAATLIWGPGTPVLVQACFQRSRQLPRHVRDQERQRRPA